MTEKNEKCNRMKLQATELLFTITKIILINIYILEITTKFLLTLFHIQSHKLQCQEKVKIKTWIFIYFYKVNDSNVQVIRDGNFALKP